MFRRILLFAILTWLLGSLLISGVMSLVSPSYLRGGSPAAGAVLFGILVVVVVAAGTGRRARAFREMSSRLEATKARRQSVLADVAHELRTPLAIIRGQAEGVVDGVYPGDAAHMAPILEASRTMERLVESLRTMALTDADSLPLGYEMIDVAVLVNECVGTFAGMAEAGGVELRVELADDLPTVEADAARLRSVVGNLVSNAVRHTPRGGAVVVSARGAAGMLEVVVRDAGPGIPAELLPRVRERFVKGAGSDGSGLGLAIADELVVAHGGRLDVESPAGGGTIARFVVPVAQK